MAMAAAMLLKPHPSVPSPCISHTSSAAKQFASKGKLLEMMSALQQNKLDATDFLKASLGRQLVRRGCVSAIQFGKLQYVLDFCNQLKSMDISAADYVGKRAVELIRSQCKQLLRSKRVEECIHILETLSKCGFSVKNLAKPSSCIQACVEARDVHLALRYAKLLPDLVLTYNIVMQEFRDAGDVHSVLEVFQSFKDAGVAPDMYTYSTLIDSCGRFGKPDMATAVFEELSKAGGVNSVYVHNSYMNVHAKNLPMVLRLFRDMQGSGVAPDSASYNIVLKACGLSKEPQLAASIYKELRGLKAAGRMELGVFTYGTLIQIFGEAKMLSLVLKVKQDMQLNGVVPNVVTWTSMIGAFSKASLVEKAFQIFHEMVESGCAPNSHTYNILLGACVDSGLHDRAFKLFSEWKTTGKISPVETGFFKPDVMAYNIMLKACSTPEQAETVMREMSRSGYKPNNRSWCTLINAYGTVGDDQGALQAFERMQRAGVFPDLIAFTAVIKACVNSQHFDNALIYYERMKRAGTYPNQITYRTLLRAERKGMQDIQASLCIYAEMRKAGFPPDEVSLKTLIEEWAETVMNHGSTYDDNVGSQIFKEYGELLLSRLVPEQNNEDSFLIDLQSLSKVEARAALLAVLRLIRDRYRERPVDKDFVIITGLSRRGEDVETAVIEVLEHQLHIPVSSMQMEEDDGVGVRKPKPRGRLRVPMHTLNNWIWKKGN